MRIVYRGVLYAGEIAGVAARCGVELVTTADTAATLRELPRAEALWIMPSLYVPEIPAALNAQRGSLRWIGLTSAGYDVLFSAGRAAGVVTTYAAGCYGPVVAEHALALLLAAVRELPAARDRQREGMWERSFTGTLRSLEDMTVAIVGFGSIGRHLARALRPLGARVVGVNHGGLPDPLADAMFPAADLHAALAQCDAVVVALTLSPETRRLFDAAAFAAMRPGTVFVNVARGGVVDQPALLAAIAAGRLRGVGLDVTDPEPLPPGDPLWEAPETLITPHVGGFGSSGVGRRLAALFERNIAHLRAGEELEGVVPGERHAAPR